MEFSTVVFLFLVIIVLILLFKYVRVVPQAEKYVIQRLGRFSRVLEPGIHLLAPFLESVHAKIDMREQVVSFEPQPVITADNVTMSIDTVLYFTVVDPKAATYEIRDLILAVEQLTNTTLRNAIGALTLDEALTSRDTINQSLQMNIEDAASKWGVKINRVEVKSIDPPRTIQEAMEKQMRAERDKRASVLTAEGDKLSQILTAEGERQSQILRAEGEKASRILTAEGERQSQILRAEGEAQAILNVFNAIHDGRADDRVLAYQYLRNTLPLVADGRSTKLLMLPSDSQGAMSFASAFGSAFQLGGETAAATSKPAV